MSFPFKIKIKYFAKHVLCFLHLTLFFFFSYYIDLKKTGTSITDNFFSSHQHLHFTDQRLFGLQSIHVKKYI